MPPYDHQRAHEDGYQQRQPAEYASDDGSDLAAGAEGVAGLEVHRSGYVFIARGSVEENVDVPDARFRFS